MKNTTMIQSQIARFILAGAAAAMLFSCAPATDKSTDTTQIALPIDTVLNLYCSNVGINIDGCVLFDPENPYANADVNDVSKWTLHTAAPSAKARFYLWATALARSPTGENQYFTAQALHELFTINADVAIKDHALLAYRSVLDNFFGSVTYIAATWVGPDVYYAEPLADKVGASMYNPTPLGLGLLYANNTLALDALSTWGYVYNVTTGTITKIQ
ncbi:MAG: hypothetical protein AUK35_05250 [Zetaproteobacteria bacterium CG2_30_46_52]|nr:MAG: hypothetical protein AUK35_05250 [Zetaproteobacteria bacterium CG2_30_46_52]